MAKRISTPPSWKEFPHYFHVRNKSDRPQKINFEPLAAILELPARTRMTVAYDVKPEGDVHGLVLDDDAYTTLSLGADPFYVYFENELVSIVPDSHDYKNDRIPERAWSEGFKRHRVSTLTRLMSALTSRRPSS